MFSLKFDSKIPVPILLHLTPSLHPSSTSSGDVVVPGSDVGVPGSEVGVVGGEVGVASNVIIREDVSLSARTPVKQEEEEELKHAYTAAHAHAHAYSHALHVVSSKAEVGEYSLRVVNESSTLWANRLTYTVYVM